MPRKQGRAASILPDLPERSTPPGPVQALRRNGRSFTLADQVHQLVSASEADPERGFMVRMMALCSRHCHVNWLTMDQATISTTQTWFYERYRGAISACDALT